MSFLQVPVQLCQITYWLICCFFFPSSFGSFFFFLIYTAWCVTVNPLLLRRNYLRIGKGDSRQSVLCSLRKQVRSAVTLHPSQMNSSLQWLSYLGSHRLCDQRFFNVTMGMLLWIDGLQIFISFNSWFTTQYQSQRMGFLCRHQFSHQVVLTEAHCACNSLPTDWAASKFKCKAVSGLLQLWTFQSTYENAALPSLPLILPTACFQPSTYLQVLIFIVLLTSTSGAIKS